MDVANGSSECAPADKLRGTHRVIMLNGGVTDNLGSFPARAASSSPSVWPRGKAIGFASAQPIPTGYQIEFFDVNFGVGTVASWLEMKPS